MCSIAVLSSTAWTLPRGPLLHAVQSWLPMHSADEGSGYVPEDDVPLPVKTWGAYVELHIISLHIFSLVWVHKGNGKISSSSDSFLFLEMYVHIPEL